LVTLTNKISLGPSLVLRWSKAKGQGLKCRGARLKITPDLVAAASLVLMTSLVVMADVLYFVGINKRGGNDRKERNTYLMVTVLRLLPALELWKGIVSYKYLKKKAEV
jgi:hypothetical protein